LPSLTKAKEKVLIALSIRRLIERGWLTALLGYLARKDELKVRLKYIGDVTLQRADFEFLATYTYYVTKCQPELPVELAKAVSGLLKPQETLSSLKAGLSLAFHACKVKNLGKKVSISVSLERVSLEVNDVSVAFNPSCVNADALGETFVRDEYEVPEVLSGLRGRDVIDVGANVGDTALYFVLKGARKVIAVEPLPNVARCAEENLKLNGVADKVKVINAALGRKPVGVPCDYDVRLSNIFYTLGSSGPCKVPGVTLGDLLSMVDDPYLLKIDCEGCEAETILGPERERLRAFEHIILETHPNITDVSDEKLLTSLKELGFECRLYMVHEPKLGQNIYHCKNSKPRQPNREF